MNDLDLCLAVVKVMSSSALHSTLNRTTNRKWPIGYQMVTWLMMSYVILKGQTSDPNTLRVQYLENSWKCYLATITNYLLPSLLWGSIRSAILAIAWLLVMYSRMKRNSGRTSSDLWWTIQHPSCVTSGGGRKLSGGHGLLTSSVCVWAPPQSTSPQNTATTPNNHH